MVLAAPTILPHVAPSRRGLVSGGIFMGVGFGIAASGTLVPLLLRSGLQQAWLGLGAAALLLTAGRLERLAGCGAGARRGCAQAPPPATCGSCGCCTPATG